MEAPFRCCLPPMPEAMGGETRIYAGAVEAVEGLGGAASDGGLHQQAGGCWPRRCFAAWGARPVRLAGRGRYLTVRKPDRLPLFAAVRRVCGGMCWRVPPCRRYGDRPRDGAGGGRAGGAGHLWPGGGGGGARWNPRRRWTIWTIWRGRCCGCSRPDFGWKIFFFFFKKKKKNFLRILRTLSP